METSSFMKPEWISAVANVVTAAGVVLAWRQIKAMNAQTAATVKQAKDDHDRSRREKAVALLAQWSASLTHKSSITRRFVESMDDQQSRDLFKQNKVSIREDQKYLASTALPTWTASSAQLTESEATDVRWITVSYLNSLESVLASWRHNVADRDILEEQFGYLVSLEDGHFILEKFRIAAGGDKTFPAIAEFVSHIRATRQNLAPGKAPI